MKVPPAQMKVLPVPPPMTVLSTTVLPAQMSLLQWLNQAEKMLEKSISEEQVCLLATSGVVENFVISPMLGKVDVYAGVCRENVHVVEKIPSHQPLLDHSKPAVLQCPASPLAAVLLVIPTTRSTTVTIIRAYISIPLREL